MSTIGGVATTTTTPPTTSTAAGTPATAPGTSTGGAVALRNPLLSAHPALVEVAAGTRLIQLGERGDHVKAVQEALLAAGFGTGRLVASGIFDRDTQTALAQLARARGSVASGMLDATALALLDAASAGRTAPAAPAAPVAPGSTVDPLAGKTFIDKNTFATMGSGQWPRDDVELEVVMGITGIDKDALIDALRATNAAGRTGYQRLRRNEAMEAYCLGYEGMPIDEMKWDRASHELRERNKFVSLTIESGRFDEDRQNGGVRRLSLGTDKMDDTYYDTASFDLLKNDLSVRGRARWDTDTEIRRILIGVKAGTTIDEFGLKRAAKTDIREDDASAEEIAALDTDVRSGTISWNGRREPIQPMKRVYDKLVEKGALPDIGPHEDVLLLEPKVHIRSVRSRYHLNETNLGSMRQLYRECGAPRLQMAADLAARARTAQRLSPADAAVVDALEARAKGLLDGSAIARAAEAKLKAIDPNMTVNADTIKAYLPKTDGNAWNAPAPANEADLEKQRAVAEAIDAEYHAFAQELDAARRIICNARDQSLEGTVDLFVAWQKSQDAALVNKNAMDPFLARYDALSKTLAEAEAARAAFNAYGEQQRAAGNRSFRDFQALSADQWKQLRPAIENEVVRIAERQIEAAGSMALGLWFDGARKFYVPQASRNTGNFLIDTLDMSEYVKHEDWESIPPAERTPAHQIPKDKIFHATLVNETQIELGLEEPYLDRMAELSKQIDADRASLFMKWATAAQKFGVDPANPATYGTALATLQEFPPAQLEVEIAALNDFLRQQGSALRPLTAADIARLGPADLTVANRDRPVRTTGEVERNLDGAKFVFQQLRDIQQTIVEAKGERILRTLRDGGAPASIGYANTDASKGDRALAILAGIP